LEKILPKDESIKEHGLVYRNNRFWVDREAITQENRKTIGKTKE